MFKHYRQTVETYFSTWQWWVIVVVTVIISQLTMHWLNGLYAQTLYPVSFMEGQTTFNAEVLKGYWAVMIEKGTLGKYVQVQIIDYLFMATVFISFAAACIAVYRSLPTINWLKNMAWLAVLVAPHTATLDAIENAISFVMLVNPQSFADWLVYPYSSFAVAKFILFSLTFLWVSLGIVVALVYRLYVVVIRLKQRRVEIIHS